jgi:uncharacterized membrane protein
MNSDDEGRIYAAFSYFIPFFGGVLVFFLGKGRLEKFHAIQSIGFWLVVFAVSVALNVVGALLHIIPVLGKVAGILIEALGAIFGLGVLALWIVLMVKAYQKEKFKLPVIGELAEK